MSDAVGSWSVPSARGRQASAGARSSLDPRRALQLALGGLWLLDGILQFQPYMFTKDFARQMLAPSAAGNPGVIAGPIAWSAHLTAQHSVGANTAFALTQLALGLGIAWRPTLKPALAVSIGWALAVWWLGEGLGGVLTGGAGPVAGGPGAAFLYAVLAVLLWPPGRSSPREPARFVAAGRLGANGARLVWFVLWAALAGFAVAGANRSAQGLHDVLADSAAGQPAWLATIADRTAGLVAGRGLPVSIALAVVLAAIAVGVFGPPPVVRTTVVVAATLAAAIWLTAQALGGLVGGQSTDPNSGPLLILLALAYWPLARPSAPDPADDLS